MKRKIVEKSTYFQKLNSLVQHIQSTNSQNNNMKKENKGRGNLKEEVNTKRSQTNVNEIQSKLKQL